jgi:hypothetical protein
MNPKKIRLPQPGGQRGREMADTCNTIALRKRTKGKTTIYKTLYRKLMI